MTKGKAPGTDAEAAAADCARPVFPQSDARVALGQEPVSRGLEKALPIVIDAPASSTSTVAAQNRAVSRSSLRPINPVAACSARV